MPIPNEYVAKLLEQRRDELDTAWSEIEEQFAKAFVTHVHNLEALTIAIDAAKAGVLSEEQKQQVVDRYKRQEH